MQGVAFFPHADFACFKNFKPDVYIFGTSENRDSDGLRLIIESRARNIPSIGIVDMLCNFQYRFAGRTEDPLRFVPDFIWVPDQMTYEKYIGIGVSAEVLRVVQNPSVSMIKPRKVPKRKRSTSKSSDLHILFVAEGWDQISAKNSIIKPSSAFKTRLDVPFRTNVMLENLHLALSATNTNANVTLRPHPKSDLKDFADVKDYYQISESDIDAHLACEKADLVVGMTSMLLQEASALGRPTLALLSHVDEKLWLPCLYSGTTYCAFSQEDLIEYFQAKTYLNKVEPMSERVIKETSCDIKVILSELTNSETVAECSN
jgi:hypothetical protein